MRQLLLTPSPGQEVKQQNRHQAALASCILIKWEHLTSPPEIKTQGKPLPISTEFEQNGPPFWQKWTGRVPGKYKSLKTKGKNLLNSAGVKYRLSLVHEIQTVKLSNNGPREKCLTTELKASAQSPQQLVVTEGFLPYSVPSEMLNTNHLDKEKWMWTQRCPLPL